ncbi:MAG: hypothetical protein ACRDBQ_19000 [Shewanella sp.]
MKRPVIKNIKEKDFDLQLTEAGTSPLDLMARYSPALGGSTPRNDVQRRFENLLVTHLTKDARNEALLETLGLKDLDLNALADCQSTFNLNYYPEGREDCPITIIRNMLQEKTLKDAAELAKLGKESMCSHNPNPTDEEVMACAIKVARAMILAEIFKVV